MGNRVPAALLSVLLLIAAGTLTSVHACSCGSGGEKVSIFQLATGALNSSSAVFTGKVDRFEWRKGIPNENFRDHARNFSLPLEWETKVAVFKVQKWWKPSLPDEVAMVTDEVRMPDGTGGNSSCNYTFSIGKSYLVFANGPVTELRTHSCSFTRTLEGEFATTLLEALEPGNEPIEKFEAEKPKLASRILGDLSLYSAD